MLLRKLWLAAVAAVGLVDAIAIPGPGIKIHRSPNDQNAVTFDEHSLFVNGERVVLFSGEFHPFRLPVPALWADVFEKIRAMGYNGVSFYVDWALIEGTQGTMRLDGIFDLEPFFAAAKDAGIWLLARPGPYINAEVSGGGFPGWLKRSKAVLRTSDQTYLDATQLYMSTVGKLIADAQITNGGPIILVQPENEYTYGPDFPEPAYFGYVEQQLRNAGVVVPLINNDAYPAGNFAPGSQDAVDIYGHDGYPLGFNCANPSDWGTNSLPTNWADLHQQQSPSTPYAIVEFQGGSFDPWGGVGLDKCETLLNYQFESVFYKNLVSFGVKILNLYMTYGGTNWGNLGHDGGYTSYDYGAAIAEDLTVSRQKYSEAKLLANSLRASPAYLSAVAQSNSNGQGAYTGNNNVFVTGVFSNTTKFFVARQNSYYSSDTVSYTITLPTSAGNITIPQINGGQLSLNGRESKTLVSDFDLDGVNLLYSSADIFTYQKANGQATLVIYGDEGQTHEFALQNAGQATQVYGSGANIQTINGATVVNTVIGSTRSIVHFGTNNLRVHIVSRAAAYNYWVINSAGTESTALPIVYMDSGYLVRNVSLSGSTANVFGDVNSTSSIEVIGSSIDVTSINFNGQDTGASRSHDTAIVNGTVTFSAPQISVPDLSSVTWYSIDGLPEIQSDYDDSEWTSGSLTYTNNSNRPLNTPTSLYAADYGYNTGSLLYRGHFVAAGNETQLQLSPQGGYGFGYTVWLNNTYIGSFTGDGNDYYYYGYFNLPQLTAGANYVFTVLIDHMGNQENYQAGGDSMKQPRGVMQYQLGNRTMDAITWKLTGNLGGENYADLTRGPLNEGGMYAERQGWHQPGPPTSSWSTDSNPQHGLSQSGVTFYTTSFDLNIPTGYTVPIALDYGTGNISGLKPVRVQMFVNGYQFGKYVSSVGPQTRFPVPEGIWNYQGTNTVAIQVWALTNDGGQVPLLSLVTGPVIQTSFGTVTSSPQPSWTARPNAY